MAVELEPIVVLIRYHAWWPSSGDPYYQYNVAENTARINYYGADYTPHFWIDGNIDGQYFPNSWESLIVNEADNWSPLVMGITGSYDDQGREGEFTVSVFAEMDPGPSNLKLRVAIIENSIRWQAPNGTFAHNQTFRDMIPSTAGYPLPIEEGETIEYSADFSIPSQLVSNNCMLVAFVQSDQNKQILQGARAMVTGLIPTGIDDENDIPESFVLTQNYPNPFNATTKLDFNTLGGQVKLEVFNLTGALVKTLVNGELEAGDHSIVWDGVDKNGNYVASGIYFYRLNTAEGQQIRKMTLLK